MQPVSPPPDLDRFPWSQPSKFADTGVHDGYRQVPVVTVGRSQIDGFDDILEQFAPVRAAWLSWIDPGGFVVEHIDSGPWYERWQIPFTEAGTLYDGDTPVDHRVGVPFRVHHDRWHSVRNNDDTPRVSLVVDRDIVVDSTPAPFRKR